MICLQRVTLSTVTIIKLTYNQWEIIKKKFFYKGKYEFIVKRSNVYSSPEILGGIHKKRHPLYSLVMSKNMSKVDLIATDKTRKYEYQMKTEMFPKLRILQSSKEVSCCYWGFCNIVFFKNNFR